MASYQNLQNSDQTRNLKSKVDTITRDKLAPIFFQLSWIENAIVVSQIIRNRSFTDYSRNLERVVARWFYTRISL